METDIANITDSNCNYTYLPIYVPNSILLPVLNIKLRNNLTYHVLRPVFDCFRFRFDGYTKSLETGYICILIPYSMNMFLIKSLFLLLAAGSALSKGKWDRIIIIFAPILFFWKCNNSFVHFFNQKNIVNRYVCREITYLIHA